MFYILYVKSVKSGVFYSDSTHLDTDAVFMENACSKFQFHNIYSLKKLIHIAKLFQMHLRVFQ